MSVNNLYPAARPSLDLNFSGSRTVDPRITFSRVGTGNIASYFNEKGVMQFAPANTPRIDFDPATLECKGLLIEEQRTNLLLNTATLSSQNVTVTATAHTLTFYGTGSITLSGATTDVLTGTGASNRAQLTFTPTAGTLNLTVSGSCTLAQLEQGSFPTSYIPTTSAQVTRAADSVSMQSANFSNWYKQEEGTFLCNYVLGDDNTSVGVLRVTDTVSNDISMRYSSAQFAQVIVATSGVNQASLAPSGFNTKGSYNRAVSYANNYFQQSINGQLPSTADNNCTIPSVNQLQIGREDNNNFLNGHIKRIAYYPKQFTDQQLQALTT